jgi:hypothetical protein
MKEMSKIYIFCPAYFATGGPELLHQLHFKLRKRGVCSFIYYTGKDELNNNYTNDRFKHYVGIGEIAETIDDSENNYLITPEIYFKNLNYSRINLLFWWLSVDYFLINNGFDPLLVTKNNFKNKVKIFINRSPYNRIRSILNKTNLKFHLYQSYYAMNFLKRLGINNILPLSDFINPKVVYKDNDVVKEDVIAYNPQKGFEITKYIMENSPSHFMWIPIENMTPEQISKLLARSKVYVDFGNHPGKDRIPREAVLNNCCIITCKRGSAKNRVDIPISNKYKFKKPIDSSTKIYKLIQDIFINYNLHIIKFKNYKRIINIEEKVFDEQIDILLRKIL